METQIDGLNVKGSAGDGTPSFELSRFLSVTIQTAGVSSSSIDLQASIDGSNWATIKTGLANGMVSLGGLIGDAAAVKLLRVHTNSISGGDTPAVTILAQGLGY